MIAVNHSPVLDEPESAKKKAEAGSKSPGEAQAVLDSLRRAA